MRVRCVIWHSWASGKIALRHQTSAAWHATALSEQIIWMFQFVQCQRLLVSSSSSYIFFFQTAFFVSVLFISLLLLFYRVKEDKKILQARHPFALLVFIFRFLSVVLLHRIHFHCHTVFRFLLQVCSINEAIWRGLMKSHDIFIIFIENPIIFHWNASQNHMKRRAIIKDYYALEIDYLCFSTVLDLVCCFVFFFSLSFSVTCVCWRTDELKMVPCGCVTHSKRTNVIFANDFVSNERKTQKKNIFYTSNE